jgi:hypothetical protein
MDRSPAQLGGLAKQRSGLFALAVAFFIIACLSAAVLAYYFAPGPPGLSGELPEPTDATRPVALSVGSTRFRIPANYIVMTSARRGGVLSEVALAAMLPRLDGYSLPLAKDFGGNAPDSPIVNLRLGSGHMPLPDSERLDRIYRLLVENPEGEAQADGLLRFSFREDSGYGAQELFSGDIDGKQVVILCDRISANTPSPNCLKDVPFGEGISLSYRFKRALLPQWREIDDAVRDLVNGFVERN